MSSQTGIGRGVSLIGAGTKNLAMKSYLERKERMLQEASVAHPPPRATSKDLKAKVSIMKQLTLLSAVNHVKPEFPDEQEQISR